MFYSTGLAINGYIILKALAMGLWFFGTSRLFSKLIPDDKNWTTIFTILLISMFVLTLDDGFLSELHSLKPETVASIVEYTGENDKETFVNKFKK